MMVDPIGHAPWWQWLLTGIAVVGAVIGGIAVTVLTGGLAGAVIAGALFGFAAGTTGSIATQVAMQGWGKVDLGKAWISGAIGAAVGAISGAFAFGFSAIGQGVGQSLGFSLSKMTVAGLQVGKVFSTTALIAVGGVIGKVGGTIAGAVLGDYVGNKLFGKNYYLSEDLDDTIGGEVFGWIVDFFKLFNKYA